MPARSAAAPDVESLLLLADLAALGDGGFVTDRLVAPLFYFLSHEMDAMFNAGEEIAFRVGYDDVNESLCRSVTFGFRNSSARVSVAAV